jgi:large-conductance mechanosensitive channel
MEEFIHFLNFLTERNILTIALIAIVSDKMINFSNVFMETMVLPIFNIDWNQNGEKDIAKIEDATVCIRGMTFKLGKLYIAFVQFILMLLFVFIIATVVKRMNLLDNKKPFV